MLTGFVAWWYGDFKLFWKGYEGRKRDREEVAMKQEVIRNSDSDKEDKLSNFVAPEPEGSLLYSQETATGPYPEPTGTTLHSPSQSP
jgi:hypothetical protein